MNCRKSDYWWSGKRIQVHCDGILVGDFIADMLVQQIVLVENKAVKALIAAHEVQLVNYLTATGIDIGLLLNFGGPRLEFKRKTRTYRPKRDGQEFDDAQGGCHDRTSILPIL